MSDPNEVDALTRAILELFYDAEPGEADFHVGNALAALNNAAAGLCMIASNQSPSETAGEFAQELRRKVGEECQRARGLS